MFNQLLYFLIPYLFICWLFAGFINMIIGIKNGKRIKENMEVWE